MILNLSNGSSSGKNLKDLSLESKDVMKGKVTYSNFTNKIIGTAPFSYAGQVSGKDVYLLDESVVGTTMTDTNGKQIKCTRSPAVVESDWVETTKVSEHWTDITYGFGKFMLVIDHRNAVCRSSDGKTWSYKYGIGDRNNRAWKAICYGDGKAACVASDLDAVYWSTDGETWNSSALPTSDYWRKMCYGNGKFIVSGNSNVYYTTDFETWTKSKLPSSTTGDETLSSINYYSDYFIATSFDSNKVFYSHDAINWNEARLPSDSDESWVDTYYLNGKFVAISRTHIAYSTNGYDYTLATNPLSSDDSYFNGITSMFGKFFIYPWNKDKGLVSEDGINWEIINIPKRYYNICCSTDSVMVFGADQEKLLRKVRESREDSLNFEFV